MRSIDRIYKSDNIIVRSYLRSVLYFSRIYEGAIFIFTLFRATFPKTLYMMYENQRRYTMPQ